MVDHNDVPRQNETQESSAQVESERVLKAVQAYDNRDVEAARSVHDIDMIKAAAQSEEKHGGIGSDYIKSIVFGGLDGAVTTFATIASVAGGSLPVTTVLVLGFANLIAEAISMGFGDGLSSKAEYDYLVAETKKEADKFDEDAEREKQRMIEYLIGKGLGEDAAKRVIDTVAVEEHKDFFVEFVMNEDRGLEVPDDPWGPLKEGAITFSSFLLFGSLPMWVYLITYAVNYHDTGGIFGIAAAATALSLFTLGAIQGAITRQNFFKAGLFMMVNGSLAGAAAYLVGWGIEQSIGVGECA